MRLIPRDPEHDIDAELRAMIAREYGRYVLDAAPMAGDGDDPEA